jgi:hypothetical protein
MKRFLVVLALSLAAIPAVAQIPVKEQRCYAQACVLSTFAPVVAGDTLILIIRPTLKAELPCESDPKGCGSSILLVSDLDKNEWQQAYSTNNTSQVWFALNAKAGVDIVGVMASFGYDQPDNLGPRGDFEFNVYLMEFPPATGIDLPSQRQSVSRPTSRIDAGTVTTSTSKTLLIAWTDNLGFSDSEGPFEMTPSDRRFTVLSDDGVLAIASAIVDIPGPYSFTATYNGNAFWRAGLVAFRLE